MNMTSYADDYRKAEKLLESTKGFMDIENICSVLDSNFNENLPSKFPEIVFEVT